MVLFSDGGKFLYRLLILLAILLAAILIFNFFDQGSWAKTIRNSGKIIIEAKAGYQIIAKNYLNSARHYFYEKKLVQMSDEELIKEIEKIEDLNEMTNQKVSRRDYARELWLKLLKCRLKEGVYNEARIRQIIEKNGLTPNFYYYVILKGDSFSVTLIDSPLNEICPEKITALCLSKNEGEKNIYPAGDEWCRGLCNLLEDYQRNAEVMNKGAINSINNLETENSSELPPEISWRAFLAYRFSGEEAMENFCGEITDQLSRNLCHYFRIRLKLRNSDCANIHQEIINILSH